MGLSLSGVGRLVPRRDVRFPRVLALSGLTGALTGCAVAVFEWFTRSVVFAEVASAPVVVQAILPTVGLALAAVALRTLGRGASPATADEYIVNFHEHDRLSTTPVWGRIVGGVATLGTGGALGFEGPSLYMGAVIGSSLQARLARWFSRDEAKLLMVAGAAAGVAAIFKAPATGAVFALEVPYQDDTAKGLLLPTLLASAAGYLAFVALQGTEPLFQVQGSPPFDLRELGGAVVLGLLCGVGARLFATVVRMAKSLSGRGHPAVRIMLAGASMAALIGLSQALFGQPLASGSGYRALAWVAEPGHSLLLVVALFAFRLAATASTLAGGGVGGLFVPLVIGGALVGSAVEVGMGDATTLFPLIGVAAFLGAGYRTPLAGVMFVAETTGRPGFVVPGLIASVAAQLVMGSASVSAYQRARRVGHLERRFGLPISAVIKADVLTVPSDTTVKEFYEHHLLLSRQDVVPVVDGGRFVGLMGLGDLQRCPVADWSKVTVAELADRDGPTAAPNWTVHKAVSTMEQADVDELAVVDAAGLFVGVVTIAEIVRLDEILGHGTTDR